MLRRWTLFLLLLLLVISALPVAVDTGVLVFAVGADAAAVAFGAVYSVAAVEASPFFARRGGFPMGYLAFEGRKLLREGDFAEIRIEYHLLERGEHPALVGLEGVAVHLMTCLWKV